MLEAPFHIDETRGLMEAREFVEPAIEVLITDSWLKDADGIGVSAVSSPSHLVVTKLVIVTVDVLVISSAAGDVAKS